MISNAVSQIPRPYLYEFLQGLSECADIMLYTSVSEERTKSIKELLVAEDCAPGWFKDLPSIHPTGTIKHKGMVPNQDAYEVLLLVDDQPQVVEQDEFDWLVQIKEFLPPYSPDDQELFHTLARIELRLHQPQPFRGEFRPSKSRLKAIAEKGARQIENLDPKDIGKYSE